MKLLPIVFVALAFPGTAMAGKAFDQDDVTGRQLIEYLDHDSWRFRHDACEELADRKMIQAEAKLVQLVSEDPAERVRRQCLKALEHLGSAQLVPAAESMALNDGDPDNRRTALAIIEDDGSERSGPILGTIVAGDPDAGTRRKAAIILGKKAWRNGFDGLRQAALSDADKGVREAAVEALGRRPAADDRDTLVTCLDDTEEDVQIDAARALVKLGDRSVASVLRDKALDAKDSDVAEEFNEAAEKLGG
ncbi:MAG: HEAT repeat domain-containing protein [Proteobacteria bacterium]|nr:HEAT repeat domain-containing protein [Pseudomonadota bacterium]